MRNLVRYRTEQKAAGTGHSLVSHHDQICADLLGNLKNCVGRVTFHRVRGGFHPHITSRGRSAVEREVDIFTGAEFMLNVGWRAFTLCLYPTLWYRFEGADHVQSGLGEPGYLGSLANGLTG